MSKINYGRVLIGGLLAGLVFNILEAITGMFTGPLFQAVLMSMGLMMPTDPMSMVYYVIVGFLMGIALVWIYAAIRPRFGPGWKTAVIAGLVGWFMTGVMNALGYGPLGIFPLGMWILWMGLWLIELPISAVAGAWLYREGGAPEAARPEAGVGAGTGGPY